MIRRRVAGDLGIRTQALIDPKGNKSDAVGMFFDEDELVCRISKLGQHLLTHASGRRKKHSTRAPTTFSSVIPRFGVDESAYGEWRR